MGIFSDLKHECLLYRHLRKNNSFPSLKHCAFDAKPNLRKEKENGAQHNPGNN